MTRNIKFAPEEFYHLYNRGTEKRDIFSTKADYDRFIALLYLCNGSNIVDLKLQGRTLYDVQRIDKGETLLDICAYCLMPNHFHFLVREKSDNGISRFMQKLTTGYTMYFNKLNDRTGALFQGKFKAKHAQDDNYLSYLISYIHLNPVKIIEPGWKEDGIINQKKAQEFLEKYNYSSFADYSGENRIEKIILNKDALPEYFETPKDFKDNIEEWLTYKDLQGSTLL